MVRVAGLLRQIKQKEFKRTADGLTIRQQFNEVNKSLTTLLKKQQSCWKVLKKELETKNVKLLELSLIHI